MQYNFELSELRLTQSIEFEDKPNLKIFGYANPTSLELLINDYYAIYPKKDSKIEKKYSKKDCAKVLVCFLSDELVRKSKGNNIGNKKIVGVGFFHEDYWISREPTLVLEILLSDENMKLLMSNILANKNPTNLGITLNNSPFELNEDNHIWKIKADEKTNPTVNMLEINSAHLTYSSLNP
jgi:hypothetical protein